MALHLTCNPPPVTCGQSDGHSMKLLLLLLINSFLRQVQKYFTFGDLLDHIPCHLQLKDIFQLRAQTYDGAANMAAKYHGAQAVICEEQPLALYVHCGAHCTNLIMQAAAHKCSLIEDALLYVQGLGYTDLILKGTSRPWRYQLLSGAVPAGVQLDQNFGRTTHQIQPVVRVHLCNIHLCPNLSFTTKSRPASGLEQMAQIASRVSLT
ncbi:hypothetical protein NDU88_007213 [Pleurodeles waltl]|uniref:Uncharacterized protein n=1 Tax=Pleurodeles waltl TaxID=8319 RepID=A0AAV7NW45_PLEWA|nr:hypothetical protein NDU88_007213 [Pleurodeles waltl]